MPKVKKTEAAPKKKTVKSTPKKKVPEILKTILSAADSKLAYDFFVMDIKELSYICDYFVLMSCKNERQIKAVVGEIEKQVKEGLSIKPVHIDGDFRSNWVVMDYRDVMVHVFLEDTRKVYGLEELWNQGKRVVIKLK